MDIDTLSKIAYGAASQDAKENNKGKWHNSKDWMSKRDIQRRAAQGTVELVGIVALFGGLIKLWRYLSRNYGSGYALILMIYGIAAICGLFKGVSQWLQYGIFTNTMFAPGIVVVVLCLVLRFLMSDRGVSLRKSLIRRLLTNTLIVLGSFIAFCLAFAALDKNLVE